MYIKARMGIRAAMGIGAGSPFANLPPSHSRLEQGSCPRKMPQEIGVFLGHS